MADIADLSARRWDTNTKPEDHEPAEALRAAMRAFDKADKKPDHIIVLFGGHKQDGSDDTRFFQAGSYSYHAQVGLIEEAKMMIRETG